MATLGLLAACRDEVRVAAPAAENGGKGATRGAVEAGTEGEAVGSGAAGSAGAAASSTGAAQAGDGPGASGLELVVCPERLEPEACSVSGDSSQGVRLIGTLLEPRAVREGGVLDIDAGGNIRCAGCDCGSAGQALVIDCPGLVVSPGFINLHDHLGYAGTPPLAHPGELYEHRSEWRLGQNGHDALPFAGNATTGEVLAHELRMVMSGVTSVVAAGGKRGLLRNLDAPGLTEGLLPGLIRSETFPLDDGGAVASSATCEFGPNPDDASSAAAVRAYLAHVGEGTNQRAEDELRCALGSLALLGENSAVVHAMALSRDDASALARRGASVVWSPRSNLDLYGATAPVALLASLGVHIALGSDWLASGSMNMLRELACAEQYDTQVLGDYFGPFELWRMVTENPAWALRSEGLFGALSPGLVADIAVFERTRSDPFRSVIEAGPANVKLVLRGGKPLYGDAELVGGFQGAEACEALAVCGAARLVCTSESGLGFEEIRSAGEAVYPLFSCEPPEGEPSCQATAAKECPLGEADCDAPAPLPPLGRRDADEDGVPDALDVCPRAPDEKQLDDDGDGRGNACDPCPSPNPGLTPCLVSVAELRAPGTRLLAKTPVYIEGARVTALRLAGSKGFYVEDGDHAAYSGIFVYTGTTTPSVALDEPVALQGYFDTFQGLDELVATQVLSRHSRQPYRPLVVAPADAAARAQSAALASLFVRVQDVEVELTNPDAPNDYDETQLLGGLRLDDLLLPSLDNAYPAGTKFSSVQGIFASSFGHQKLLPRSLDDLAP